LQPERPVYSGRFAICCRQDGHVAAQEPDRLALGFQFHCPHPAFLGLFRFVSYAQASCLGTGTGTGNKAAKRQRSHRLADEILGHERRLQGRHLGVDRPDGERGMPVYANATRGIGVIVMFVLPTSVCCPPIGMLG
jgi:hypothetical protein